MWGRRARSRRWGQSIATLMGLMLLPASPSLAAPGDLDGSFSGDGKQLVDFGGNDRATHVAMAPDGRIVLLGSTDAVGAGDYAVARLGSDGTPDGSFGGTGRVTLGTQTGVNDIGGGVVVLPDERIVVSGQGNSTQDFVTRRLNANGTLDTTFASGGISTVDFGGNDADNAMVRQADGKLVLVGSTSTGGGDFAIVRLNADGTPDTSFSSDGKQTVDFGGNDAATGVAITSAGQIVVAGQGGPNSDMVVTRLNSDGTIDTSFATSGKAFVNFGGTDGANAMALQPDGRIVLVGSTSAVAFGDFAIARLNADGTPDTSFSGDGKLTEGFGAANETALGVAIQQNNKIVLMGTGDANADFVVVRLLPDGTPDSGFGTSGTVGVTFGGNEFDGDLALQSDGQIVIAGSTDVNTSYDMAVARLNGDPIPVTTTTTTTAPTTTTPAPAPAGPTARIVAAGFSDKLPGAIRFSGRDSTGGLNHRIDDYHWVLTLPHEVIDADCGTSPVMSAQLPAGASARVRLTVITNALLKSTTQRFIPIHHLVIKPAIGKGIFDCENPAAGNQPSRADCVKSYGFGLLDVGSRGGVNDCFEISHVSQQGKVFDEGKISGPVAINGLYVPVPKGAQTVYDSTGEVSMGQFSHISVRVGPFLTKEIDLNFKVTPDKHNEFKLVDVDAATNAPKFLGSLPVRGAFSIVLTYHASKVKVGLGLPSPLSFGGKQAAQGDVYLISDNVNGLHYDGLSVTIPSVWIGPLYVSSLNFHYRKSDDSWGGAAKVTLPGSGIAIDAAGPPTQPPDYGFGIVHGRFGHLGFGIDFQPPTQPDLFPPFHTVLLTHIGASVGARPLRLTGSIGFSAANIVKEDGVLFAAFASQDDQYTFPADPGPELRPLANRTLDRFSLAVGGTASLKVPIFSGELPLLNAYGLYEFPDYFEFGGSFSFGVSFIQLDGSVSGFAYPSSGKFNAQAGLKACARKIKIGYKFVSVTISPCFTVGGVVSSKGIGVCGIVPVPFPIFGSIPVSVGAGYRWGDSLPKLMLFSCDYGPYAETSPLARSAAAGYSVDLPPGLPAAMFRIRGQGGDPSVTLTDPRGHDATGSADTLTVEGTDPDTTLVALRHPIAGRWRIAPAAGSVPIVDVATAKGLPALNLKASVTGRGSRRILHYRFAAATGRGITFLERGRDTARVLGSARGGVGQIPFTPGSGSRGRRTIVAQIDEDGAPARELTVAKYTAPGPASPVRPRRVLVKRRRGTIDVSWSRIWGATRYELLVKLADHSEVFRVLRRTHVRIQDPMPSVHGTVTVDGIGVDGRRGAARTVRLARVRVRRR
jgi:uncharacterized delta-60 repeat protein